MRWAGHAAHMGGMRRVFWLQNLKGRDHSQDLDMDEWMDLRKIGWEGVDWFH
jgi:hypothetical protein